MSKENGRSTVRRIAQVPDRDNLSVLVACHTFVCAISTRYVTQLALNEDVNQSPTGDGIVLSAGTPLASFNLGILLGAPPLASAWVLLRVPYDGGEMPIALRTGTCLIVREVTIDAPLPAGLFASRGAAVLGAFVAGSRMGLDESLPYGLVLEVGRLWTDNELRARKAALGRARKTGAA